MPVGTCFATLFFTVSSLLASKDDRASSTWSGVFNFALVSSAMAMVDILAAKMPALRLSNN